jgi:hypothetical protein
MGREIRRVEVAAVCFVSRHNSKQDDIDDALVEEMRQRLQEVARPIFDDPRYKGVIGYTEGIE